MPSRNSRFNSTVSTSVAVCFNTKLDRAYTYYLDDHEWVCISQNEVMESRRFTLQTRIHGHLIYWVNCLIERQISLAEAELRAIDVFYQ